MRKFGLFWALTVAFGSAVAQTSLLNVSYDPTRELYRELNAEFAKTWKAKTGTGVTRARIWRPTPTLGRAPNDRIGPPRKAAFQGFRGRSATGGDGETGRLWASFAQLLSMPAS